LDVIKSKDNSIIKLYSKLSNNRKDRKKLGLFVLEGYRIVVDAFKENAPLTHVLVSQGAYEKYSQNFTELGLTNVTVISNDLAVKVSSTESTQGVFAICEMPKSTTLKVKEGGKYIVLYQVQDPGNVGMIVRTADAFGLDGVILSQSCDFYSPKVIRSTMGSAFRVNHYVCDDIQEVLDTFKHNGVKTYSAVIDSPNDVKDENFMGGSAIVVGNEGNGLPTEVAQQCDRPITINMSGSINSLNVAMASGIIMWKMAN
jgi:TrmH family RNA methyltransferase